MEISVQNKKLLKISALVNFLSLAVQSYLTLQHYRLKFGAATEKSICNINATFNCDAVSISKFAAFFGLPVALLAAVTHIVAIALLLSASLEMSSNSKRILRYSLWISFFIAIMSVVMGGISSLLLNTFCLFCIACYVLSFIALYTTWKAQEDKLGFECMADLKALVTTQKWVGVIILLIPALSFVADKSIAQSYLGDLGGSRYELLINTSFSDWQTSPAFEFNLENSITYQSSTTTPVMTIVEFADFLCPHCKLASPGLKLFAESKPDVRLVFKAFPLDGNCNKDIEQKGNGVRCTLAAVMYCSEKLHKKGWEANQWLFDHQDVLHSATIKGVSEDITKIIGGSAADISDCTQQDATNEALIAQAKEGANAKLEGTPTIYVNGKKLEKGQFIPMLEKVYQSLKDQ